MKAIAFNENMSLISIFFGKNYIIIGAILFIIILCACFICIYRCYKWFTQWEIKKKKLGKEKLIELRNRMNNPNKEHLEEIVSVEQQLENNRKLYRKKKPNFSKEKVMVHNLPSIPNEEK